MDSNKLYKHDIELYIREASGNIDTVNKASGEHLVDMKVSINPLGQCVVLIHKAIELPSEGISQPRVVLLNELSGERT